MKIKTRKPWKVLFMFVMICTGLICMKPLEAKADSDYILEDSDRKYLSSEDIKGLSLQEVCYAKNEIYARRGRRFQSQELQRYFDRLSWYNGTIDPSDFDENLLNGYEAENVKFLSDREFSLSSTGYVLDQPGYDYSSIKNHASGNSEYLIDDSDERYLTASELDGMSLQELCYAKNEIYARHGRKFQSQELKEYFNSKSWYQGTVSADSFSESVFNKYEEENVILLKECEFSRKSGGYVLDQPGYDITAVCSFTKDHSSSSDSKKSHSSNGSSVSSSSSNSSSSSSSSSGSQKRKVKCWKCHGRGTVECSNCDGSGGKYEYDNSIPNYSGSISGSRTARTWVRCYKCHGSGSTSCSVCGGSGETG